MASGALGEACSLVLGPRSYRVGWFHPSQLLGGWNLIPMHS
jgi:hypothetical protein